MITARLDADGSLYLTVTFKQGSDIDRAQVQVQNRVSQALPRLPEEVRNLGVTTIKSSVDGLIYALLTAGTFGWLWPK